MQVMSEFIEACTGEVISLPRDDESEFDVLGSRKFTKARRTFGLSVATFLEWAETLQPELSMICHRFSKGCGARQKPIDGSIVSVKMIQFVVK
jgi:hypothetical protein